MLKPESLSKHGPLSPVSCTKKDPDGKWSPEAWPARQTLIETTLQTGRMRREGPTGPSGYRIYEETFINSQMYCPTCPPNAPIGYEYPPGGIGPGLPVRSVRVITRPDGVIINAYPIRAFSTACDIFPPLRENPHMIEWINA